MCILINILIRYIFNTDNLEIYFRFDDNVSIPSSYKLFTIYNYYTSN